MNIAFIQTGGTIDKDYTTAVKGYNFEIDKPAISRILKKTNPNFDYKIYTALKKDSLDITNKDRQKILSKCLNIPENKIVITHGTDTMVETGLLLGQIKNKTIVLTGSMLPERFSDSDAPINIGMAIAAVQAYSSGVYIAMHGRIYPYDSVIKNQVTGQFVEK